MYCKRGGAMNKKFAWELFKNTGNIDAYLLMKDVEYGEQMIENTKVVPNVLGDNNGNSKDQGNSHKNS